MPALKNHRMESLAQGLAAGKTQKVAYAEAGYTGTSGPAVVKAANRPDVLVRTQELIRERHENERAANAKAIENEAITKGYLVTRSKYIIDRGIRGTKPIYGPNGEITGWLPTAADNQAALGGIRVLAHMGGFLIDRVEMGGPGEFARMTAEELDKQLLEVGESIGIDQKALLKVIKGGKE